MASKAKLRWQTRLEDELRTRFVCTDVLQQQLANFAGCQQLAQLGSAPSTQDAQQYFERAVHLQSNGVFGPHAPKTNSAQAKSAELHALLLSHSKRVPGLNEVLRLCKPHQQSSQKACSHEQQQPSPFSSPLVRLLRRVSLWYYYRVMFDPLDQLVQLNSSYELLFQLLTPHQQLSCMADILLVLACPALAGHSDQLDTPLHTATLLSMLKMAQQLAEAEAQLQEQQQYLHSIQEQLQAHQGRDQDRDSKFVQVLQQQHKQHHQEACAAAGMLTTPGLALLQLSRQQSDLVTGVPQKAPQGLWPNGCRAVQGNFLQRFRVLVDAVRQQESGRIDMLGSLEAQAALQQATSCKAVGALLSQLSLLPQKQLLLWWHSQEPSERPEPEATHTATVAHWLQRCCSALQLDPAAGLELKQDEDPISTLMLWVMRALAGSGSSGHSEQQQQQHRQQQQRQGCGSDQQHPAEALRQVLDVLLSALQYRHGLSMQEWEVREVNSQPQKLLLSALHCHCMQLLTQARQQLPPELCTLQHSNGSRSSGSRTQQQQQQQAAWRLCCSQVQHNLLLVLQLTKHWQKHNACGCFQLTLYKKLLQVHLVAAVIDPVPGGDLAMAYQRARHITTQNLEGLVQKKSSQQQQQQQSSGTKADAVPPAVLELLHVCVQSSELQRTLSGQVPGKLDAEALGLCRLCGCNSVEELAGLLKVAQALAQTAVPPSLQPQHVADDKALLRGVVDLYCTGTRTFAELTKQLELVLAALGCKQHKEALLSFWRAAAAPLWQAAQARGLHHKQLSAHSPADSSAASAADVVAVQQVEHHWAAASGAEDASSTTASVLRLVGGAGGSSTAGSSVAAEQVTTEFDSDDEVEQQLQEFELGSCTAWQDAAGPQLPSLPNTQLQQQPGESDGHSSNDSGSDSGSLYQLPGQVQLPSAGAACAGAAPLLSQEDEAAAGRIGSSNPPSSPVPTSPQTRECPPAGAAAGRLESLYHAINVMKELNIDLQWSELEEHHPDRDVKEWLQQLASGHWSGVSTGVESEDHCRSPVDTVDRLGRDLPAGSHVSQGVAAHAAAAAAAAVVEAAAVQAVHEDSSDSSPDSSSDTSSSQGTEEDLSQMRSRTSRTHSSSGQAPLALLQSFDMLLAFWKERLNKQSKHRYQHQQQQHSRAPQVSPKDPGRVYLTGRGYLFQGMELSAATPWVELAIAACSTDQHRLRPHLCRALMCLKRLGLPTPSSDTDSNRESPRRGNVDQPGFVHALLTLLLTADGKAGCRTTQQLELWQQGHSALVALLDAVYTEVCNRCKHASMRVGSFGREAYAYIVGDLKQLTAYLPGKFADMVQDKPIRSEDLSGVKAAVQQWVAVLDPFLLSMDPQEVKDYSNADLEQMWQSQGADKKRLAHFARHFDAAVRGLQRLIRIDAWLSRVGRHLQVYSRILRRASRALDSASSDPYLLGLYLHRVEDVQELVTTALAEVAGSHVLLRQAFATSLASNAWGVIQHAVNLQYVLLQAEAGAELAFAGRRLRDDVACVLADMVSYLQRVSPYIPKLPIERSWTQALIRNFSPPAIQQVITLCSSIDPPAASLWFLLPGREADAGFEVEERAEGRTWPYDAAPFKSRRSNSSSKRSTPQQQHHDDETFVSGSSWDDSDSDTGIAPKRKRPLPWYFFSEKHRASYPTFCYCSSEDEPAVPDAEAAMQRAGDATDTSNWYSQELQRASRRDLGYVSRLSAREQEQQRQYLQEEQQLYAKRVQDAQQMECLQRSCCKKLLKTQLVPGRFARDCRPCLRQGLPWHSAESCSTSSSLESSDGNNNNISSSDSDPQALTGLRRRTAAATRARMAASSGCSGATAGSVLKASPLQQGGWVSQRRAAQYDWGRCRPWHLERMRVLTQRQQVLHRVSDLQAACDSALALLEGKQQKAAAAAAAAAAASHTWQQGGQQQHSTQPDSSSQSEAAAAMGRVTAPIVLQYTCGAAVPGALTVKLSDQQQTEVLAPLQPLLGSAAPVGWSVEASRAIEECRGRVQQAQQHVQELCSPEGQLLRELVTSRVQEQPTANTAGALHSSSGGSGSGSSSDSNSSTRQLLWEVLQQLKSAACQWYEHGAQHYQQQQKQQPGKSCNSKAASPTPASFASSSAVPVPECCSVQLWSTMAHSIAADLLLVPPSIRDIVGNGWAAGAGRLGDMGADITTTSSSSSSVAARMLVLQYARAARQKYAQTFQNHELLWQLLVLQLLAEDADSLTELQPGAAASIAKALAAHANAAAAGMWPLLEVAAESAGIPSRPALQACKEVSSNACSGHSFRSSSSHPCRLLGDSSRFAAERGQAAARPCYQPNIFHLSSQLANAFPGPADVATPWLQLLARYHCFADNVDSQHAEAQNLPEDLLRRLPTRDTAAARFDPVQPQGRLAAMAVALQSFGSNLPGFAALLCRGVQARYQQAVAVPLLASPVATPMYPQQDETHLVLKLGFQQQQRQRQPATQAGGQGWPGVDMCVYWLHAERLLQVQPQDWQQHVMQQLLDKGSLGARTNKSSSRNGRSHDDTNDSTTQARVLTDGACDWCCGPVHQVQSTAAAFGRHSSLSPGSSSSSTVLGCTVCGCAQYCSEACAAAAKELHNTNCWRLQALATDGRCWQQPALQSCAGSTHTRAFFDLSRADTGAARDQSAAAAAPIPR